MLESCRYQPPLIALHEAHHYYYFCFYFFFINALRHGILDSLFQADSSLHRQSREAFLPYGPPVPLGRAPPPLPWSWARDPLFPERHPCSTTGYREKGMWKRFIFSGYPSHCRVSALQVSKGDSQPGPQDPDFLEESHHSTKGAKRGKGDPVLLVCLSGIELLQNGAGD